jgi:flagellar biosynthesis/type III secretory pathway chaperone
MMFARKPDSALLSQLADLLDEEISLLNAKSEQLGGLSAALIDRDDDVMHSLDDDRRGELDYRRRQIVVLARRLRHKHLRTVLLLAESARINRLFLERLFPACRPVQTYGAAGVNSWRAEAGLFDAEI